MEKVHLTHNQSYKWGSGVSVNSQVDKSKLLSCMFGSCIKWITNWAVAARRKYLDKQILASKIDFESAYCQRHLNNKVEVQTCTQILEENLAMIALRLTFGGTPGTYEWGVFSETICDLSMTILHRVDWDPTKLHSQSQIEVPKKKVLNDDILFASGRDHIVNIPVDDRGFFDIYIDNIIGLSIDQNDNDLQLAAAALLAIHTTARPIHKSEPIPRDVMEVT